MLSSGLTVPAFFQKREQTVSPETCAAGVATQSTDVLALVMRFCAGARTWSHDAFVSKTRSSDSCKTQQCHEPAHDRSDGNLARSGKSALAHLAPLTPLIVFNSSGQVLGPSECSGILSLGGPPASQHIIELKRCLHRWWTFSRSGMKTASQGVWRSALLFNV